MSKVEITVTEYRNLKKAEARVQELEKIIEIAESLMDDGEYQYYLDEVAKLREGEAEDDN